MNKRMSCSIGLSVALMLCLTFPAFGKAIQNVDIITVDQPWLHEIEFLNNQSLHATRNQTVVLHLEHSAKKGSRIVENTLRFLVNETNNFRFCIPGDDPHLRRLRLKRTGGPTLLNGQKGERCRSLMLTPGSYVLEIHHNTYNLPAGGSPAFFHLANQPRLFGSRLNASTTQLAFLPIRGPNGKLVTTNANGDVLASGNTLDASSIWQPTSAGTFNLRNGNNHIVKINPSVGGGNCSDTLYTGSTRIDPYPCETVDVMLQLVQSTGESFRLVGQNISDWCCGGKAGFLLNENNVLQSNGHYDKIQTEVGGDDFTADYRGFTCANNICDSTQLVLQQGEVALFAECGYQGPAIVFTNEVAALSAYNTAASLGFGIGDNQAASVRVGPDTLAQLYVDAGFSGASLTTDADIPCLDGMAVASGQLSSLRIDDPASYIISTRRCTNCILPGIDLSDLDLIGADFSRSDLTGAVLSNTSLEFARLDETILASASLGGASLAGAALTCTDLSLTDLRDVELASTAPVRALIDSAFLDIVLFDETTGDRGILANSGAGSVSLVDMARESSGALVITDSSNNALFRIAPTGVRSIVSSMGTAGNGPTLRDPRGVAVASDGTLLVTAVLSTVYSVDPVTGDREVLSDSRNGIGTGPAFQQLTGIAAGNNDTVYVVDIILPGVFAVDRKTGDRSILSGPTAGTGTSFQQPVDIVVDVDGSLLISDAGASILFRVGAVTGDRTIVSGPATGSGPDLLVPTGLYLDKDGSILVADTAAATVLRVELATGNRQIITGAGIGSGPILQGPSSLSVLGSDEIITTDFSCRLDLTDATLDITTFPAADWRYFDLTGATIDGAAGAALSTAESPLDLSGAILSGVHLEGATLDYANMGCTIANCQDALTADIDAVTNEENHVDPVSVTLEAGTWEITPVRGSSSAWNAWGAVNGCDSDGKHCTAGWLTVYEYWSDTLPPTTVGDINTDKYQTPELALTNAGSVTLTLDKRETVSFTIPVSFNSVSRNLGKLSLKITSSQCASPNAIKTCATLKGIHLNDASLRHAVLSEASMEGANLSSSNLDSADMSGAQLTGATLNGAFMRNVSLAGADLTGAHAQHINFFTASGGKADATGLTAPGADFTGAYMAFADFSGAGSLADLQGTTWTDAFLLGVSFKQTDLGEDTSGGVITGRTTTFEGSYLQGASFDAALLDKADFTNTYWYATGADNTLNVLIPKNNLQFVGYWKDLGLPECPPKLMLTSTAPPSTDSSNTCPNSQSGPCDEAWGQPQLDISSAFFKSAQPPSYPQDPTVSQANQCSGNLDDPNPYDLCWTITTVPPPAQCVFSP